MARPTRCPRCGVIAGVPIEYGLPDRELFEQAQRGEVEIGGCLVGDDAPDRFCRACRHSWVAGSTEPGPRTVPTDTLTDEQYHSAVRTLRQRTAAVSAVCEVLLAAGRDHDHRNLRTAHDEVLDWLRRHHRLDGDLTRASWSAGLVVPADNLDTALVLEAAADVCSSLQAMWGILFHDEHDTARIRAALDLYEQRDAALTVPWARAGVDRDALDLGWLDDLVAEAAEAHDIDEDEDEDVEVDRPEVPPDPEDGWDEFHGIAAEVFDVWVSGSEQTWARYAWGSLRRAGLTAFDTEVERGRVVCRLLAVSVLYREFCVRAFDEGSTGEWYFDTGAVVGEHPLVDPFVLGQLAERDGVDADDEVGAEFEGGSAQAYAIRELVRSVYPDVASALLVDLRQTLLFASLWASAEGGVRYPLHDDEVHEAVNTDVTGSKMSAWDWVDRGMPID